MKEADKKTLNLFIEKAEELKGCDLLKAGHKLSFSIKASDNQGAATTSLPREEQLRSFLLVFRNFYSPGEEIHFPKVCRILINNLEDEDMKKKISNVNAIYDQTLAKSPVLLIENSNLLTPNDVVRRWLYGFYHHTDTEKRAKVDGWGFAAGLLKMEFISTVFNLARCVIWLSQITNDYVSGKIK